MTKLETMRAAARGQGCLGRADDDEPVFVLRAKDALAADILWEWIHQARVNSVNSDKIDAAQDDLEAFRQWRKQHGTKLPD